LHRLWAAYTRRMGLHEALQAAALVRIPLVIAGQVFPHEAHERYFTTEIQPRLGPVGRFLGVSVLHANGAF
jgi:hypothetical protein